MTPQQPGSWLGTAIGLVVIAVVLALRWRRMGREQPLKPGRLWIVPVVIAGAAAALFTAAPPSAPIWLACAVALAVGAALGWQRGKTMRIALDPDTGALTQATSPAALVFLGVLVIAKVGGRALVDSGMLGVVDPAAVTDPLIALAVGLVTAQRAEMWLRARRLRAGQGGPR